MLARLLETESIKVGLQIDSNKTKLMKLINNGEVLEESEGLIFDASTGN